MSEELRATLERAIEAHESRPDTETGPIALPEAPAESGRGSDEGIAERTPAPEAKSEPVAPTDTRPESVKPLVDDKAPKQPEEKPAEQADLAEKAPAAWRPTAKAKWDKVDPEIRQEVSRRERFVEKTLQDASNHRKFADGFGEVIQPYLPRLNQANVHPLRAVQSLLAADHALANGPMAQRAELMAKMIKDYQIDILALDAALTGKNPAESSPTAIIDQRVEQALAPVRQFIDGQRQQIQQREQRTQEEVQQEVNTMANDAEKFPEFWTVQQDMADITESYYRRGVYLSAEEAYNRAVRMNPESWQREQGRAQHKQAQAAHAKAQRSLGASLSVTGSAVPVTQSVDPSDLRGTIEAAWNTQMGR